jgi:hypothetical protein
VPVLRAVLAGAGFKSYSFGIAGRVRGILISPNIMVRLGPPEENLDGAPPPKCFLRGGIVTSHLLCQEGQARLLSVNRRLSGGIRDRFSPKGRIGADIAVTRVEVSFLAGRARAGSLRSVPARGRAS